MTIGSKFTVCVRPVKNCSRVWGYLSIYGRLHASELLAKLFDTNLEAEKACQQYKRKNPGTFVWVVPVRFSDRELLSILKHQLKLRAKGLFNLSARTPAGIVADRYEDAMMGEEATLLRMPLPKEKRDRSPDPD